MENLERKIETRAGRILIVDDDEDLRRLLALVLRSEDHEVEVAASAPEARARLSHEAFDLVITDLSMPVEDGLSLMRWARSHHADTSWIVLTGFGNYEKAVEALRLGAFDFLSKPIRERETLLHVVRKALDHQRLLAERDRLHRELKDANACLRAHVEQLHEACSLLSQQADVIRADLDRAGIIQRGLLPRRSPQLPGFQVRSHYRPSQSVGGDLYDVIELDDRYVALLIGDATGHGLAAAMLAVLFRSRLPFIDVDTGEPRGPGEALRWVNRSLNETLPERGLFLTAVYCLLDTRTRRVRIASAGHPPLIWMRHNSGIERVFHTGPALGLYPYSEFGETEIQLEHGDELLLYSDGLYDRLPNLADDPRDPITAFLETRGSRPTPSIEPLFDLAARPVASSDDVTALMLRAVPGTSHLDNGTAVPLEPPSRAPRQAATFTATHSGRRSLSIQGSADWRTAPAIYAECSDALESDTGVMIDLGLCDNLDSTALGTIHRLCELADEADLEFRIQNVSPSIEALFDELGMQAVLDHVLPCLLPLPTDMSPISDGGSKCHPNAEIVLEAHRSIVALNDRNRREFGPLLAQLRQEVGETAT